MVSLNKCEGDIQQKPAIFVTNEVHKLKEEIHNLKLESETLKIQNKEREKMIMALMATSNKGNEYQNSKFLKTSTRLSKQNLQIQEEIRRNDRRLE